MASHTADTDEMMMALPPIATNGVTARHKGDVANDLQLVEEPELCETGRYLG